MISRKPSEPAGVRVGKSSPLRDAPSELVAQKDVYPGIEVSSTEPAEIVAALNATTSTLPEDFGGDYLFSRNDLLVSVQRKTVPDLVGSVYGSDRLVREVAQMQAADLRFLVLEGFPFFQPDGKRPAGVRSQFSRKQLWGLLLSLQLNYGIAVVNTGSQAETVEFLRYLPRWVAKAEHRSLQVRGKSSSSWDDPLSPERRLHFLQGLPGIGRSLAEEILRTFGRVPCSLDEDLRTVPGIGKIKAERIDAFFEGVATVTNNEKAPPYTPLP